MKKHACIIRDRTEAGNIGTLTPAIRGKRVHSVMFHSVGNAQELDQDTGGGVVGIMNEPQTLTDSEKFSSLEKRRLWNMKGVS